ncbi:thioesterase family protein [Sphingobium sp. Sx8-8]|uniref:acyl-CoA thioesterase n=1 Tax=Sphingobium sp. Sx8-8 TaxID=2933617 RepID=UPI001F560125
MTIATTGTGDGTATETKKKPRIRATRKDYAQFRQITTRWMDNDVYGHVNNVIYYSFFDTAVNAALIDAGVLAPERSEVIGLVVETGCRYAAPISFPETVDAGIRVAQLGTSSVRYEIGLFRGDEEEASAEGFFVHVYVDRDSRRPAPLPEPLRAFLSGLVMNG